MTELVPIYKKDGTEMLIEPEKVEKYIKEYGLFKTVPTVKKKTTVESKEPKAE